MNLLRCVVEQSGRLAAMALLLLGVLTILGREVAPQVPQLDLARPFERDRFTEVDSVRPQNPGAYLVEIDMIRRVRAATPESAFFLVFHQNTFAYYAGRRFIRDVDTRLVEFYRAPDRDQALAELRKFGIEYVYLPPWKWPTIDRSHIKAILDDASIATLLIDHSGYRLYRLHP